MKTSLLQQKTARRIVPDRRNGFDLDEVKFY